MGNISRRSFLKSTAFGTLALAASGVLGTTDAKAEETISWDYEADVVVIGAGGAGLPAALKAMEDGASVLLVEANFDVGGHAAVSGGNLHNGAYIDAQKEHGLVDSADLYYFDHTRGVPYTARTNDREVVRATANSMAESFAFFLAKGMKIQDREPSVHDYYKTAPNKFEPESVARQTYADPIDWKDSDYTGRGAGGIGVTRPLEKTLRDQGAKFLMNYHMDKIYREEPAKGHVLGIRASYTPHILPGETEPLASYLSEGNIDETRETVNIRANKAVIIATGGSIGNLNFRQMVDPRIGVEFDGLGGMPFSDQDASGELAAMEIGGSLGCLASFAGSSGGWMTTPSRFGCQYGYGGGFNEKSPIWKLVRANGIAPVFNSLCIVNMLGRRCGNEDFYNTSKYVEDRFIFFDTAFSSAFVDPDGDGNAQCYTGPLWAIMDQAAVERNDYKMEQGIVDFDNGYAFKGETIEELAQNIVNKYYEDIKMDPATLAETIRRYNGFVEAGKDEDWGKTSIDYKIEKGPFYALWATPSLHDSLSGLRVNGSMQVKDIHGELIPNLFCAGESAAGMRIHGLGRVMTAGYIAGRSAASVDENGIATASLALKPEYAGLETNHLTSTATRYDVTYVAPETSGDAAAAEAAQSTGDVFIGTSSNGINGLIQVEVTVANKKITAIKVVQQSETEGIGTAAYAPMIEQALEKQSANVDSVAGATVTSEAFKEALQNALFKAGI